MNKNIEKTAKARMALISLSLAVMLAAAAVAVIAFTPANGEDMSLGALPGYQFDDGNYSFTVITPWDSSDPTTHGTVSVTGFASSFTVTTPCTIDLTGPWEDPLESGSRYDVTVVETYAFSGYSGGYNNVVSLVLPSTVTVIEESAFSGNHYMVFSSSDLGNVEYIGDNAFFDSPLVGGAAAFSNDLYYLGVGAFYNTGVTSADLSGTLITEIYNETFRDCTALTSVVFPNALTSIGGNAFNNTGLTTVDLSGTSVPAILDYVFYGCTALTTVILPSTVTSVTGWSFEGCINLSSINLDNVRQFGLSSFSGCTSLSMDVVIADYVSTDAFYGCNLGYLVYPLAEITTLYNNRITSPGTGIILHSGMSGIILGLDVSGDMVISSISPAPSGTWELRIGTSPGSDDLALFSDVSGFTAPVSIPGLVYITFEEIYGITYVIQTMATGSAVNPNPAVYTASDGMTLLPLTVPSGYRFIEWQDSTNTAVSGITAGTTGPQTFTAVIQPIDYDIYYHGLPAGSTAPSHITYSVESAAVRNSADAGFAAVLPVGYTMSGWLWGSPVAADFPDDPFVGIPASLTGDIHLWAAADAEMCTITITDAGTVAPASVLFEYRTGVAGWAPVTADTVTGYLTVTAGYGSMVMIRSSTFGYTWTFDIPAGWTASDHSYEDGILSFIVNEDTFGTLGGVLVTSLDLSGSFTADKLAAKIVYGGEAPFKTVFEYMASDDGVTWPSSWTRVEGNEIDGLTIGQSVKIRSATDKYTFEWDLTKPGMSTYAIANGELTFVFDQTFIDTYDGSFYGDYTYESFSWAWFIIAVTMVAVLAFFIVSVLRRP